MQPDVTKLQFWSGDPIDKAVSDELTASYYLSGPSGSSYATSDQVSLQTIVNPYGKKCLIRYRWSIDGTNFNEPGAQLQYSFTVDASAWGGPVSDPLPGIKAAMAMGCDDNLIYFRMLNGYHSNVAYTGTPSSPGPDSYTAFPLTFTIQYILMEIDL